MNHHFGDTGASRFLLRSRYQIAIGLFLAIAVPVLLREAFTGASIDQPTQHITAIGAAIALITGFAAYRRIQGFPGIASGGHIFTSFTITFGLLATGLFMLRLDYSRFHFLISYLITVALYIFMHLYITNRRPIVLGVVPSSNFPALPTMDRVVWHRLFSPAAPTPRLNGVVADLNADHDEAWSSRIADFALQGIPVYHVKQAIEQITGRVEIDHLSENTLGSLNPNDIYLKVKEISDFIIAAIILVTILPALVLVAIIIRMDSPGPALFRQERTGFRAQPFTVYKFRTMRVFGPQETQDATVARESAMTKTNDPRITKFGMFLRKSRIDELPQLINILRREMSLIGPRPEATPLTRWYEQEIPFYHYRHIIKPGVTGWAQVNQGHVAEVSDVREKLHLDFYYVKNFSFWLDALIAIRTVQTIFTGKGAR